MDSFAIFWFDGFLVFRGDISYRFNPLFERQDYSDKYYICTCSAQHKNLMIIWSANMHLKSAWFKSKLSVSLNLSLLVAFFVVFLEFI